MDDEELCSLKFNWPADQQECDGNMCTWWEDGRCAIWWAAEIESDLSAGPSALPAAKTP
jgi:hypothetical protein